MFDSSKIEYRYSVPYIEIMNKAKSAAESIAKNKEGYGVAGQEYIYFHSLVTTFSNVKSSDIDEDINGFMDYALNGSMQGDISKYVSDAEVHVFANIFERVIDARCNKPPIDELIENINGVVTNINKILTDADASKDLINRLLSSENGQALVNPES